MSVCSWNLHGSIGLNSLTRSCIMRANLCSIRQAIQVFGTATGVPSSQILSRRRFNSLTRNWTSITTLSIGLAWHVTRRVKRKGMESECSESNAHSSDRALGFSANAATARWTARRQSHAERRLAVSHDSQRGHSGPAAYPQHSLWAVWHAARLRAVLFWLSLADAVAVENRTRGRLQRGARAADLSEEYRPGSRASGRAFRFFERARNRRLHRLV